MTSSTFRIGGERSVRRLGVGAMHLPTSPAPPGPQRDAAICGDPEFLRAQVDEGLRRLRVDRLQPHRLDS
ncbi:MAG: hypothetical protein ACRDTC_08220, partial [Pseudonocardiaceae bacterium]